MKIIMYGAEICGDCVLAKEQISKNSTIELDYRNITENTTNLKEFLSFRDNDEIFAKIKETGRIGIPFFVLEDGTKTLDISDIIEHNTDNADKRVNTCSLDGKGQC